MTSGKSVFIPDWVMAKMRHFCGYQERCMQDVIQKLKEYHLRNELIEKIILQLTDENLLDEQRFARIYTGGKIRINKWGRKKIRQKLYEKKVPELFVEIALQEVDMDEYLTILKDILEKKNSLLKEKDPYKRSQKLYRFALSRGFEMDSIKASLNMLL